MSNSEVKVGSKRVCIEVNFDDRCDCQQKQIEELKGQVQDLNKQVEELKQKRITDLNKQEEDFNKQVKELRKRESEI